MKLISRVSLKKTWDYSIFSSSETHAFQNRF